MRCHNEMYPSIPYISRYLQVNFYLGFCVLKILMSEDEGKWKGTIANVGYGLW